MEASGGYERVWAKALRQAGLEVRIVDPKRVRSFAQSAGRLAKNDKIDAEMIAWFAETFTAAPSQARRSGARGSLAQLVNARQSLIDLQSPSGNAEANIRRRPSFKRLHARLLKKMAGEIATIETVDRRAGSRRRRAFAVLAEIIQSVPGLPKTSALTLIAALPELGPGEQRSRRRAGGRRTLRRRQRQSGAANAASRAAAAGSAMPSTCPASARRR